MVTPAASEAGLWPALGKLWRGAVAAIVTNSASQSDFFRQSEKRQFRAVLTEATGGSLKYNLTEEIRLLYFEQRAKTYIEEVLVPALGISVFYYVMEFAWARRFRDQGAAGRGQIHFHLLGWLESGEPHHIISADTAWCSSSPPTTGSELSVKDVAFGILTAKNLVQSRVHAQQLSWLPQARDVVFYSEADLEALQPTVALEPPPKEELALMDLHKRFPRHAWIFFCDDDTYVYMGSRNLLAMLGSYHAERDWYTRWAGDIRVGKCVDDLAAGALLSSRAALTWRGEVFARAGFHHESHDKYEWDNTGGGHPYGDL
ncbi:hypothetical protein EMIHUDRAFT_219670 [Emiliania huxleyi CCMP1516]|uniref:Fringe-like glycosyltransferase domain-containing protein n=2 Tax=Emiliania huxleyi TaxID=2903 RepID=A0A0D3I3W7_EMIH1|nr:hypothetical protein EMIHUDRAFT_219670 [Emiliania huxleyi CCMP1516]EOD05952.1 hypothetical protein EMIHUDRAFT_219670 [Emiliania huxleyi CCMP1516]|eukprot:XP_005758381.1 hypothetical protein EMIHUDRAFT_219670 [Emiliania huxleyi CCMP1516]